MQIKFLLLSGCLFFSTIQAFSTSFSILPASSPQDVCTLPPPAGFQIMEIGPDYLVAGWTVTSPTQGAHRVKVYRASDNSLLKTQDIPAGIAQTTIDNLPVATNFIVKCCEICSNGEEGEFAIVVPDATILDLIVKGYNDTNKSVSYCQIDPTHSSCTLAGGLQDTYFQVTRISGSPVSRRFVVTQSVVGGALSFQIKPQLDNSQNPSGILFLCPGYASNQETSCYGIPHVIIKGNFANGSNGVITELVCATVSNQANALKISSHFNTISNEYIVKRLDAAPPGGLASNSGAVNRDELQAETFENLFISPNPFTESIDLTFYLPPSVAMNTMLITPDGRQVYAQHLDAGQSSYSLSPSNLPAGLYFLRIEAGGEIRTIKMVKAE